jgi:hypothetical protein
VSAWLTEADIWTGLQHVSLWSDSRHNARSVEPGSRRDSGFLIEIKIDQVAQKSGDISQKRLDFSYFLLEGICLMGKNR